jgi:protein-tyrosine phosphatase
MRATAEAHGVSLQHLRARQVDRGDLRDFDYVFAMDRQNHADLLSMTGTGAAAHIHLFRRFDPVAGELDVPDPYYGGSDGFERVFEIVDRTSRAILDHICSEHDLPCADLQAESDEENDGDT